MLSPGTQIDRFELVCPVGEGGMAQVWVARQRGAHGFEKLFALKAIHPRYADDPRFRAMFLDEARIAAAIEHPNVAQIYDLGERDGLLYIVMEYVDGEAVSSILQSMTTRIGSASGHGVATGPAIALKIVSAVCAGLDAAHRLVDAQGRRRGVVHRDVSPHNVLVSTRGDVKLIDFGIAKAITPESALETESGALKGKIHYMAPEQVRREPLGPYTDVFGAGALLYRLLSGRAPYDVDHDTQTVSMLLARTPAPRPLPDSVPPLVAAIVERAIAPDPGDRYVSAGEMQRALDHAFHEGRYAIDLAGWVKQHLSGATRARQTMLAGAGRAPTLPSEVNASSFSTNPVPDLHHGTRGLTPMRTQEDPAAIPLGQAPTIDVRGPGRMELYRDRGVDIAAQIPPQEASQPGFMDVRALIDERAREGGQRTTMPHPGAPTPAQQRNELREPPRRGKELDAPDATGSVDMPDVVPAVVGVATTAGPKASKLWLVLFAVLALVALGLVVMLIVPGIVKSRVIHRAKEAGVDLTIGGASFGLSGVRLTDIHATIPSIPAFDAHVDEAAADGLRAKNVRLSGVDVKVDGPLAAVGQDLAIFYGTHRGAFAGTASDPRHVSVVNAHLGWTDAFGKGTSLQAGDISVELDAKTLDEIHANLGRFDIATPKASFGPWALAFDRDATSTRARLSFDPPVPDGPSAMWVMTDKGGPTVTVRIPRVPIATLGLHPEAFGLPLTGSNEVELKVDSKMQDGVVQGQAKGSLYAVKLASAKAPIDIKLDASFSGKADKPLDLDHTTLTVGPFVAALTGTVAIGESGVRVETAFKTVPVACLRLVRPEVKTWGPLAGTIADIALGTGAVRVTGNAEAAGTATWDSGTPDVAMVDFTVKETCGLSIFGL